MTTNWLPLLLPHETDHPHPPYPPFLVGEICCLTLILGETGDSGRNHCLEDRARRMGRFQPAKKRFGGRIEAESEI